MFRKHGSGLVKSIVIAILGALMVGCSRGNMGVSPDFFLKKGTIGLVWSCKQDNGQFIRSGPQGLLDIAVTSITSGPLPAKVESLSLTPLVDQHYLQPFEKGLSQNSFKANMVRVPLDKQSLKSIRGEGEKGFWIDFSEFKSKYGLDYVVYLEVEEFGTFQSYSGIFATSNPKGHIKLNVFVVDTTTNTIVGEFHATQSIEPVGKWDNPPDFPEVVSSIETAIKMTLESAYVALFKTK